MKNTLLYQHTLNDTNSQVVAPELGKFAYLEAKLNYFKAKASALWSAIVKRSQSTRLFLTTLLYQLIIKLLIPAGILALHFGQFSLKMLKAFLFMLLSLSMSIFQTVHTSIKKYQNRASISNFQLPTPDSFALSDRSRQRFVAFWEKRQLALALICFALGALIKAYFPVIQVEANYQISRKITQFRHSLASLIPIHALATSQPQTEGSPDNTQPQLPVFNPLIDQDGKPIFPADTSFGLIIPKIGINATVVPYVDPGDPKVYTAALKRGVAHAATSYFPDQNGSVYLFSHSTNYEWFVKDLNALFYLLNKLENQDLIVVIYKNVRYTYAVSERKIVPPTDTEYIYGIPGKRELILQTCTPAGTTLNRLLIFADLVDTKSL
jgi:LPXTG-site transpeptidase (sortase) family protein